ncbi:hypothetical protein M0R04_13560 [Candidatus Dojkabacteria bacterium]|jgi:hypothetical protein|nr:hypothetical protein [Candidatus Dojkabacteria bacterium]
MSEIYTNLGGNSPQAQATAQLQQALSQITSMPSADLANVGYSAALNQPAIEQQAQQDLTQQSGIPQLQSGQQDLGKIFELYLADGGLSQKYMNTNNNNPYASPVLAEGMTGNGQIGGEATSAPNPYLNATPEQILASTQPSEGSFTNPSQNSRAMMAVPSSTIDLLNLLQTAVGGQQDLVKSKMGDVSKNYQAKMGVLQSMIDAATKKEEKAAAGKKRETGLNKDGDLIDMQTGEIIKDYGGGESDINNYILLKSQETRSKIDDILPQVSWFTVGPASNLAALGAGPAADFKAKIDSITASLAERELVLMRSVSPTGGALGQASDKDVQLLKDAAAGLSRAQSPGAFIDALNQAKDVLDDSDKLIMQVGGAANGVTTSVKSGGSSDVKTKLKAAGYSDSQINEYLKMKGK